jgi:signal transduction histidine kinase
MKLVNDKGEPYSVNDNPFNQIFKLRQPIRDNEAFLMNHSANQVPISLNISPLLDNNQQVMGAVAVFRDVSQERAEEQQRADFISTASHEMRTPVAAIEGYLSLSLNSKVSTIDHRARDYLEKAHASTQQLGQLFQDLLTSAKAEDGRLTSHPEVLELGGVLEQLTNDLRFAAEKKGLFMEFTVGSGTINASGNTGGERTIRPLYYVYADAGRLREVITNLFDNAIKYTPEGKISIGLTGNDNVVQCHVRDTGPGIPAENLPHLFQKFYRVDNSSTRTVGGTGLGLFICRKIIELYNGRIWVESELGKGSTFYINLPRLSTQRANELQNSTANQIAAPEVK